MGMHLSEAAIKLVLAQGALKNLHDPRYSGLWLKVNTARSGGSWYLAKGRAMHKLGTWPELSFKAVVAMLPEVRQRLAGGAPVIGQAGWSTVHQVLAWYRDRVATDRQLTEKRKVAVRSAIDLHLVPRVGGLALDAITHTALDQRLMWPLQAEFSLSYARLILRVMGSAFKQALKLKMIDGNPMAGMTFGQFVKDAIKPKAAKLHGKDVEALLPVLVASYRRNPVQGMLALMMLAHGTRIGETRQARWTDFSLSERVWVIPAATTKTRAQHVLPLTAQACALLRQYRETQGGSQAFLFPARRTGGPLADKQASELFASLADGRWSSHDLRKVARTGWADLKVDYLIGELLLNHAMGYSAQTYINTSADDLKRDALERWHAWLDVRGFNQAHGLTGDKLTDSKNSGQPSVGAASGASSELLPERPI